jgi:HNH endonuclease/NUMOD4 motif
MREHWKQIEGFDPKRRYEVSNQGRVRGMFVRDSRVDYLTQTPVEQGYRTVSLAFADGHRQNNYVHVLVAKAFVGSKPSSKHEVNHKDLDKSNNCWKNLEWTTPKGNRQHYLMNGYVPHPQPEKGRLGESHHNALLTNEQVRKLRQWSTGRRGEQREFAKSLGVSVSTVGAILRGQNWAQIV